MPRDGAAVQAPRVLVIDDDSSIRRLLRACLPAQGFHLIEAENGQAMRDRLRDSAPDLCLLDLGLPDADGLELIQQIRRGSLLPIIVLSARDQEQSKITALNLGADDYVTKPFAMGELVARIRTALRHQVQVQGGQARIDIHGLAIDLTEGRVTVDGRPIRLSATEYKILRCLAIHAGRVLTHRALIEAVWGSKVLRDHQYLRVYIRSLRLRLEPDPGRPIYILTESGVGYRLRAPD